MKQKALPHIPISEIHAALLRTQAGKSLRSSLRYQPFRHKNEDPKYWRLMLGPSAVTYSHLKHVYKLTERSLRHELNINPKKFSPVEQEMLLLAALSHDFGEAILDKNSVGDVPAPKKLANHEKLEQAVFRQVLKSLKLDPKLKNKLLKAYLEVCHNKKSPLFNFFHLIEHLDYIDTGMRLHKNLTTSSMELSRGKHIIGQILTYSVPLLVSPERNSHHSTRHFIRRRRKEIDAMFRYCLVEYRRAEKLNQVILGIDLALICWKEFALT